MLKINKIKKEKNVNNVGAILIARKPQRNTITNEGANAHVYSTTKKYNTGVGANASVCPNSTKTYPKKFGNRLDQPAAITLVALIITIIILIILAGVTLNLALGQNGIFVKSKEAVDKYKDSAQKEQEQLDNIYDNLRGPLKTDGSYNEEKGINTPVIKNPNANTKMELVRYDEEKKEWVKDTNNSSYNYVAGTGTDNTSSHWANAKVTVDGVESFFVWIPRFAYKIDSANQKIDIVFLKDKTDTYIDENGEEKEAKRATDDDIGDGVYLEDYIVHPAFTKTQKEDGTLTYDNGEWKEELAGLWIGKYETSHTGCTEYATSGEGTLNENKIKIQPGITSWRKDIIGNFYIAAKNYSTNLNSHMLKNSEWGAVAYLTHSKYGRNGHEITINDDSNYITGKGGNDASSTGNEYGIYDLSGGACEYVASYYKGGSTLTEYGSPFTNNTSDAYLTAYDGTTESTNYKKGDATYETKNWNSDAADFVLLDHPFFNRGGSYRNNPNSGVFYYGRYTGSDKYNDESFRMCLAV